MSLSTDPTLRQLNHCGCCDGSGAQTPLEIYNRAGLPAIAYRIGTHASFKETLLARLSSADLPALRNLRTRDDDDFTIALLDCWAMAGDILTFYQERIANESFLRTATETTSLYALAALIGYQPNPGVAASAYLAFIVESASGAPLQAPVAIGTRITSIPGPGEKPQTFETIEAITARPEWNAIQPLLFIPQPIATSMDTAVLKGLAFDIQAGDSILIVGSPTTDRIKKLVTAVRKDTQLQTTSIDFTDQPLAPVPRLTFPYIPFLLTPLFLTSNVIFGSLLNARWRQSDFLAQAHLQRWPIRSVAQNIVTQQAARQYPQQSGVFPLQRALVFGHNAPAFTTLPASVVAGQTTWDSPSRKLSEDAESSGYVYLDAIYRGVVPGSWVILESPSKRSVYQVSAVAETSIAQLTLSGKVTRIQLSSASDLTQFGMRETTVWLTPHDPLTLADLPLTGNIPDRAAANQIVLDGPYLELTAGLNVILTGERSDLDGVVESELLTILEAEVSGGFTVLTFIRDLRNSYKRSTVQLNANVALATHGENSSEALGGGDASVLFQSFRLRQPPLTFVSSATPSGAESTLEVRVDDVLYQPVDHLYGHGPGEHVYELRQTAEGDTWVRFGDGITGARLPSGLENVTAVYRKGMGEAGLVAAGQLSLLLTRPTGIRSVMNPLPASGAADAEQGDQVRSNATVPLATLDRIVSLRDYEDFARAFGGIAKALATWTWDGQRQGVFLTVAGPKAAEITPGTPTYSNLLSAIALAAGSRRTSLRVDSFRPALFRIEAKLKLDPAYQAVKVLAAVSDALRTAFSFDQRRFGQPVTPGEVDAVMHSVPGVIAVDVDRLYRVGDTEAANLSLAAALPQAGVANPTAAELLLLDPRPIPLGVMS